MKKIVLTQNKYVLVDDEDFERLNQYKWFCGGRGGYAVRMKEKMTRKVRKMLYMAREVLNYSDKLVVDHINGNKLDNRKQNLRIISNADNVRHRVSLGKANTSGFRGVHYLKSGQRSKRWMAQISFRDKQHFIGYYFTPQEASIAWESYIKKNKIFI